MQDDPNLEPIINLINYCFLDQSSFDRFVIGSFVSAKNQLRGSLSEQLSQLVLYVHSKRKILELLAKLEEKYPEVFAENETKIFQSKQEEINYQRYKVIKKLIQCLQENLDLEQLKPIYLSCCPNQAEKIVNDIAGMVKQLDRRFSRYSPLIPFVVKIQQEFSRVNQLLENLLNQYGDLFGYNDFRKELPLSSNSRQNWSYNSSESSLLIAIEQKKVNFFKIQAWFWSHTDRSSQCQCIQEPDIIVVDIDKNQEDQKLPKKINELIAISNKMMKKIGSENLRIELFLPNLLLKSDDFNLEWIKIEMLGFTTEMCKQYPVVFRLSERLGWEYQSLKGEWKKKWQQLESTHRSIIPYSPNIESELCQAQTIGISLDTISHYDEFFKLICLKALPIALWSRRDLTTDSCLREINRILNSPNVIRDFRQLPQEIKNERNAAQTGIEHIGHHICLLWDDPKRMPPDETQLEYSLSAL